MAGNVEMDNRVQLLSPGLGSHGEETQGSPGSGHLEETATVAGRSGQTWSHRKAWLWPKRPPEKGRGHITWLFLATCPPNLFIQDLAAGGQGSWEMESLRGTASRG